MRFSYDERNHTFVIGQFVHPQTTIGCFSKDQFCKCRKNSTIAKHIGYYFCLCKDGFRSIMHTIWLPNQFRTLISHAVEISNRVPFLSESPVGVRLVCFMESPGCEIVPPPHLPCKVTFTLNKGRQEHETGHHSNTIQCKTSSDHIDN